MLQTNFFAVFLSCCSIFGGVLSCVNVGQKSPSNKVTVTCSEERPTNCNQTSPCVAQNSRCPITGKPKSYYDLSVCRPKKRNCGHGQSFSEQTCECECVLRPPRDANVASPCKDSAKNVPHTEDASKYFEFNGCAYNEKRCNTDYQFDGTSCKCECVNEPPADANMTMMCVGNFRDAATKVPVSGADNQYYALAANKCKFLGPFDCAEPLIFISSATTCDCRCDPELVPDDADTSKRCYDDDSGKYREPSKSSETVFWEIGGDKCTYGNETTDCPDGMVYKHDKCGCICPAGQHAQLPDFADQQNSCEYKIQSSGLNVTRYPHKHNPYAYYVQGDGDNCFTMEIQTCDGFQKFQSGETCDCVGTFFIHPKEYLYLDRADAEADCQALGARLAEIRSDGDLAAVQAIIQANPANISFVFGELPPQYWIGLELDSASGNMRWSGSGQALDYGNFTTEFCQGTPDGPGDGRAASQNKFFQQFDTIRTSLSSKHMLAGTLHRQAGASASPCGCALLSPVSANAFGDFVGIPCALNENFSPEGIPLAYAMCQSLDRPAPASAKFDGNSTFFLTQLDWNNDISDALDGYFNSSNCRQQTSGSFVPSLTSRERLNQLTTYSLLFSNYPIFFIGLVSEDSGRTWNWNDGTPLDTTSWANGSLSIDYYDYFTNYITADDVRLCAAWFIVFILEIPCDPYYDYYGFFFGIPIQPLALCQYP